ncbi:MULTISPECIES: entericidin A/B family lipoprotein [unclassified Vreelandella]
MTRALAMGLLLLMTLLLVSGCNTIRGAGEDIEQGGSVIQDAAE